MEAELKIQNEVMLKIKPSDDEACQHLPYPMISTSDFYQHPVCQFCHKKLKAQKPNWVLA